jgi:hypothetical protein
MLRFEIGEIGVGWGMKSLFVGLLVTGALFLASCESPNVKKREHGDSAAMKRLKHLHRGPGPGGH